MAVVLLVVGTFFYRQTEGWSTLDSLYFSVITLTTVGYGDLHPSTAVSKIFTIVYIFLGIGIIVLFVNKVAERAVERRQGRRSRDASDSRDAPDAESREEDR